MHPRNEVQTARPRHDQIEEDDIGTRNLAVRDWFDQALQQVTARVATYMFTVAVSDLAAVSAVIARLAAFSWANTLDPTLSVSGI